MIFKEFFVQVASLDLLSNCKKLQKKQSRQLDNSSIRRKESMRTRELSYVAVSRESKGTVERRKRIKRA